jgi:hypothetical protein
MHVTQSEAKTYCIGRQLVSIPAAFSPSAVTTGNFELAEAGESVGGFDVVVREAGLDLSGFRKETDKRRTELKNRGSDTVDVLRSEMRVGEDASIFRVQQIDDAYVSEANFLRGTALVTVRLDSFHNQYERAEQLLRQFISRVRDRAQFDIGKRAGTFCFGPVVVLGDFAVEGGSFTFRDGRGDVFDLSISTQDGYKEASLLERMASPDSLLAKFNIDHTVIRARQRMAAAMPAQEWLGRTDLREENGGKALGFSLETYPAKVGKRTPLITVSFDTARPLQDGASTTNWMSDDEATQLWDSVVGSLTPALD